MVARRKADCSGQAVEAERAGWTWELGRRAQALAEAGGLSVQRESGPWVGHWGVGEPSPAVLRTGVSHIHLHTACSSQRWLLFSPFPMVLVRIRSQHISLRLS